MPFNPDSPVYFLNPDYRGGAGQRRLRLRPGQPGAGRTLRRNNSSRDRRRARLRANAAQAQLESGSTPSRAQACCTRVANTIEATDMHLLRRADVAGDGQALSGGDRRGSQLRRRCSATMPRWRATKPARSPARRRRARSSPARYEPLGVRVHIMPFNFPMLLMCWTVAASLRGRQRLHHQAGAGDDAIDARIHEGLPRRCRQVSSRCLPGGAPSREALVASDKTHAVAFTGSVAAGSARCHGRGRRG